MNKRITFLSAIALISAAAMPVFAHSSFDNRDIVRDVRGNAVMDVRGNCVRTKWTDGSDDCGQVRQKAHDKLASVYFDFNSSKLTKKGIATLDNLLKVIRSKKIQAVTIAGYADAVGSDSYNLRLSEKRAVAVKKYLSGKGFKHANTDIRALGKSAASAKCKGLKAAKLHACMQEDRRVDIELSVVK
jgi:outer membrane protein OmpA-like peptidoglycan-associated protein